MGREGPQPGQTIAVGGGHLSRKRRCSAPGRGKSELQRAVRRVIPGQGDLKESGTENIPPAGAGHGFGRGLAGG